MAERKKKITEIQPNAKGTEKRKIRVAAYCRVSTDMRQQELSFLTQKGYYTKLIKGNKDWRFAGICADKGISGTKAENRTEFQKLINDCQKGLVDMVLTKSISRFARNTVDCISAVRLLKSLGIGTDIVNTGLHFFLKKLDLMQTPVGKHSIAAA